MPGRIRKSLTLGLLCLCSMGATAQHNSENSLDWQGDYRGVMPCADCAGIEISITLEEDRSYQIERLYRDENNISFIEEGQFRWLPEGSRIVLLDSPLPNEYLVQENRLVQLNRDGNRIVGELADRYILEKQ